MSMISFCVPHFEHDITEVLNLKITLKFLPEIEFYFGLNIKVKFSSL